MILKDAGGPLAAVILNAFTEYPSCQLQKEAIFRPFKINIPIFIDSVESTSSLKKLARLRFPNGQSWFAIQYYSQLNS